MSLDVLLNNFLSPPVLFFFLGLLAVIVKSDLEIPEPISKFLSLFLLFEIGMKGGHELYHSGYSPVAFKVLTACFLLSLITPFVLYRVLRFKLDVYNSGAIAAAYGSISAVTFVAAVNFLEGQSVEYGGYMMAGMALMEFPAIVSGLILVVLGLKQKEGSVEKASFKKALHESCFNGSVFLLVGSLLIGLLSASQDYYGYRPFSSNIFAVLLAFYMLDMGLLAGKRVTEIKKLGGFLILLALIYPVVFSALGLGLSMLLGLSKGDALLLTVLAASASHIAVPAAMRLSLPKANMSLLLFMSLCITLTFNISVGIPVFYMAIEALIP
jgi:hypothetical protein